MTARNPLGRDAITAVDVAIVGSGPNGLAAAVTLARAGLSVRVFERADTIGGGARTQQLTEPGFWHDVCSAVHPQAFASPFFRAFELRKRVEFAVPEISYAHPLDGAAAAIAYHDLERTVDGLGVDGPAWRSMFRPLLDRLDGVIDFTGHQLLRVPRDPVAALLYGLRSLEQGSPVWGARWRSDAAKALFTGVAAHASTRQPSLAGAGAGLLLATHGHAGGWPVPIGGSQAIVDAMAADLIAHGGTIETGRDITSLDELPRATATVFDTSARDLARIVGRALPDRYHRAVGRLRYGAAVAKVDFALNAPVPWLHPELSDAGTLHLGGSRAELAASEREISLGRHAERPYVLVSQPSRFDASRAPLGMHTLWAYAHVPAYSDRDPLETVTAQIERYAPGFRDTIVASASKSAVEVEASNSNFVGGDISGGAVSLLQLIRRPVVGIDPWSTPNAAVFLCSSSTPPGPSVHGMNGWFAARSVIKRHFGSLRMPSLSVDK